MLLFWGRNFIVSISLLSAAIFIHNDIAAEPSPDSCRIEGYDKDGLMALRQAEYHFKEPGQADQMALEMLPCLSDPDPDLRDKFAYEGYVNKYPDLFIAYNANPRGKSQSDWGRSHYCRLGRDAGRTIPKQVRGIAAETILDRAKNSGAIESEIQKYEGDLKRCRRVRKIDLLSHSSDLIYSSD